MNANATTIEAKAVLITGANRGLGRALCDEAVRRGATRVYAGTRKPVVHADDRVVSLTLDVTDPEQIAQAAESVTTLDVLINNAGISLPDALADRIALEQHLAVNLYGTWGVTDAFLPLLARSPSVVLGQRGAMPADRRRAGAGGVGRDVSGPVAAPRRPRSRQRLRGSRGSRNRRVQ